jgi:hypothetical protein
LPSLIVGGEPNTGLRRAEVPRALTRYLVGIMMQGRRTDNAKQPIVLEIDAQRLLQGRNEAANVAIGRTM